MNTYLGGLGLDWGVYVINNKNVVTFAIQIMVIRAQDGRLSKRETTQVQEAHQHKAVHHMNFLI